MKCLDLNISPRFICWELSVLFIKRGSWGLYVIRPQGLSAVLCSFSQEQVIRNMLSTPGA